MTDKSRRIHDGIATAVECAKQAIKLIDKAKRKPAALSKLEPVEAQLSEAMKNAFVLSLMAQDQIRAAIAQGQAAQSMAESLAAARQLYTIIVAKGDELLSAQ